MELPRLLYGVSMRSPCYTSAPWRAPMETPWRSSRHPSPPSPRLSRLTRGSWSGWSHRRRLIRSRSCCYRVSSTGCVSGATRAPTRSTGGSSGESPPGSAKTTSSPAQAGTQCGSRPCHFCMRVGRTAAVWGLPPGITARGPARAGRGSGAATLDPRAALGVPSVVGAGRRRPVRGVAVARGDGDAPRRGARAPLG
jgi:hypothetical protein